MRSLAFENLLKKFEVAHESNDKAALDNLVVKSRILRSRKNDAAVIRELVND